MREWLSNSRKDIGMTMKDISGALGISEAYYCCIENGGRKQKMDAALIARIARVLGMEPAQVLEKELDYMRENGIE